MTSILSYVCNLIAGKDKIADLYFAIDRTRNLHNKHFGPSYKVSFPPIGTKVYTTQQLIRLEDLARCTTYNQWRSQLNGLPTLDQYVVLLIKGREAIRGLFQANIRAGNLRQQGKLFCYTFVNPFTSIAGVNRNNITFTGANQFRLFFCQCERNRFNPLTVINGLLQD